MTTIIHGCVILVIAALLALIGCGSSEQPERESTAETSPPTFEPSNWYWFSGPKPDFTGKVIVARKYSGTLEQCVNNLFAIAQDVGGTRASLDKPAELDAAQIPSRYVYVDDEEIADIGCMEGLQTVTATPEVAKRLHPAPKAE